MIATVLSCIDRANAGNAELEVSRPREYFANGNTHQRILGDLEVSSSEYSVIL